VTYIPIKREICADPNTAEWSRQLPNAFDAYSRLHARPAAVCKQPVNVVDAWTDKIKQNAFFSRPY